MAERIVVALGGNALIRPGQRGTIEEQRVTLTNSLAGVVELIRQGYEVILTHGNGPQVGNILLRAEAARDQAYEIPLDVCDAQSQGEMGYLIQQCLQNLLREHGIHRPVATVITQVIVDQTDPRMKKPSKPVGPFCTAKQAEALKAKGFQMAEDSGRGYRRVVPSPMPLKIVEQEIIRKLLDRDVIVIAVGGGGIPVYVSEKGDLVGVEAVIDKDLASSLLAISLKADKLLDLTAVEKVKLHFGTPAEQKLDKLCLEQAKKFLREGHFAPGSMGPKIEAAIQFLESGGKEVIITLPERALDALQGRTGTHVVPK
jgi:carbamate kinase